MSAGDTTPRELPRRGSHPDADRLRFVLVEPQHPGNVGAVTRVLTNLGFHRLVLVNPSCDPRAPEARRRAVDAADRLDRAMRVAPDLDVALDGAAVVIGTTRRAGRQRRPHRRVDTLLDEVATTPRTAEVALLFGREAHGLNDAELDRCTHLTHLPASPDYPSFNLAQAVGIAAYQWTLSAKTGTPAELAPAGTPATHREREAMYAHVEEALKAIGFLGEQNAESMMRKLRRMLGRALPTPDEVRTVRGAARQALWVAGRAGLTRAVDARQDDDDRR